ncbi:hypothetical protein GCM10017653_04030 [Ancylobacter defluvii]|uniref:Uncharacterized protein n=1 Tax=Ancylobacter defluvii TaxID=1282440 RepID=A0A9W6JU56_9HYPH|nr:hypothetical protein GCM10017653_04030 [Ancylobacter defluvii]
MATGSGSRDMKGEAPRVAASPPSVGQGLSPIGWTHLIGKKMLWIQEFELDLDGSGSGIGRQ